MAQNPYVNKVQKADGTVIMDISNDTATPSDVLNGATFHDRSGTPQTGAVITHNVYDGLNSTSTSDALSANQGKVLNSKINDKLDYYTLLNGETVTSTLTNKTLFGSRKLSNYKLLLAVAKRGGVLRVSLITAQGLFSGNTAVMSLTEVDSSNTQRWYEIKYVNDTTVSIQCSSNASGADVYLYGLH